MKISVRYLVILMIMAAASPASASLFSGLPVEDTLALSDCVFLAEVQSVYEISMNYLQRTEYAFKVLEVIHGDSSSIDSLIAACETCIPSAEYSNDHSGYTLLNDTVLVFSSLPEADSQVFNIICVMHIDSLDRLKKIDNPVLSTEQSYKHHS